eukprot:EG_transcript_24661
MEAGEILDTNADIATRVGASVNPQKLKVYSLEWGPDGVAYRDAPFSSRYGPEVCSTSELVMVGIASVMGEKPCGALQRLEKVMAFCASKITHHKPNPILAQRIFFACVVSVGDYGLAALPLKDEWLVKIQGQMQVMCRKLAGLPPWFPRLFFFLGYPLLVARWAVRWILIFTEAMQSRNLYVSSLLVKMWFSPQDETNWCDQAALRQLADSLGIT